MMTLEFDFGVWNDMLANATQNMISGRPDCLDVEGVGGFRDILTKAAIRARNTHGVRMRCTTVAHCGALIIHGPEIIRYAKVASDHAEMDDRHLYALIVEMESGIPRDVVIAHWEDPQGVSYYKYHTPDWMRESEEWIEADRNA